MIVHYEKNRKNNVHVSRVLQSMRTALSWDNSDNQSRYNSARAAMKSRGRQLSVVSRLKALVVINAVQRPRAPRPTRTGSRPGPQLSLHFRLIIVLRHRATHPRLPHCWNSVVAIIAIEHYDRIEEINNERDERRRISVRRAARMPSESLIALKSVNVVLRSRNRCYAPRRRSRRPVCRCRCTCH